MGAEPGPRVSFEEILRYRRHGARRHKRRGLRRAFGFRDARARVGHCIDGHSNCYCHTNSDTHAHERSSAGGHANTHTYTDSDTHPHSGAALSLVFG